MVFSNSEAINIIEKHIQVSEHFLKLREKSKELYALVEGDGFIEELIERISFIEGEKKALARERYARDTQAFFERLFQPLENISYATGGNKVYDIDDKEVRKKFVRQISNIKDSNTLQHWVQNVAIKLSHVDPNGIMFMEYSTKGKVETYPTYKGINTIRAYQKNGQLLDWVLFEPEKRELNGAVYNFWRLVDDKRDMTFIEKDDKFTLVGSESFTHPFGEVPAIINSNIVKIGSDYRLSPISKIIPLVKEYARDLSIKTVYKFTQGFPIHWRYGVKCDNCSGTGKKDGHSCKSCDGRGYLTNGDVTDMIVMTVPKDGETAIAPNIAGHIKPDNETWDQYTDELELLQRDAIVTYWGTPLGTSENFTGRKTTTEVMINKQPIENVLNRYADYAEFVEWKISEWILNFIDKKKDKKDRKITVNYGRNYVIEPSDTILKRYTESKKAQENDVVLDKEFRDYLQSIYRTDPVELHKNILKSKVEPYLHQTLKDVMDVFGAMEAQRKILFSKWWDTLRRPDFNKDQDTLIKEYDLWFESNKKEIVVTSTTKAEEKPQEKE